MSIYVEVKRLDKGKCRYWGCRCNNSTEVHHIIPRSAGGPNEAWNLITLCSEHHNRITSGKYSNYKLLVSLRKKRDFRWGEALEHYKKLEYLKELNKIK